MLVTMMVLIYFFGRERGIRDRIQMNQRLELQELAQHLRFRATTDPLTGLYNRAKFDESLASEAARSQRYKSPLAPSITSSRSTMCMATRPATTCW